MPTLRLEEASNTGGVPLELYYETFGEPQDEPLLAIMGLGAQCVQWDEDFCRLLASQGHFVVRFDNRDIGLSSHLDHLSTPRVLDLIQRAQAGERPEVDYTLTEGRWRHAARSLVTTAIFLASIVVAQFSPSLARYTWLLLIPAAIFIKPSRPAR